jgi:hypothetical protein
MIHSTTQNGKFIKLVRWLRKQSPTCPVDHATVAVGILERMWHLCISSAKRGDIGKMENDVIAESVGWHGCPDELVSFLVECGWLDECSEHRIVVHNWEEHAPRHIKKNSKRLGGLLGGCGDLPPLSGSDEPLSDHLPAQVSRLEATPNETKRNETKPNQIEGASAPVGGGKSTMTADEFFERWNKFAEKTPKISKAIKLSKERRKKINTRLKENDWLPSFIASLRVLPLKGEDGDWQPTLDWMVNNEANVFSILEGKFDFRCQSKAVRDLQAIKRRKATDERERRIEQEKRSRDREAQETKQGLRKLLEEGCETTQKNGPNTTIMSNQSGESLDNTLEHVGSATQLQLRASTK